MSSTPPDPLALFRGLVTQWEQAVNQHGTNLLAKPEVAQAMQGLTSVGFQAQAATHDAMAKFLAAANLPSKADVATLGERLTAIEAALARIEARQNGGDVGVATRPKPARTRRPG